MSGDWKPGTVAKATVRGVPDVTVFRVVQIHRDHVYRWAVAAKIAETAHFRDEDVTDVRPLVVLDPSEAPHNFNCDLPNWIRISAGLDARTGGDRLNHRPALLRWLADQIEEQTRPPRTPEPGYGAIVSSIGVTGSERRHWVRGHKGWTNLDATGTYLNWTSWDALRDPVLVREGVAS